MLKNIASHVKGVLNSP